MEIIFLGEITKRKFSVGCNSYSSIPSLSLVVISWLYYEGSLLNHGWNEKDLDLKFSLTIDIKFKGSINCNQYQKITPIDVDEMTKG